MGGAFARIYICVVYNIIYARFHEEILFRFLISEARLIYTFRVILPQRAVALMCIDGTARARGKKPCMYFFFFDLRFTRARCCCQNRDFSKKVREFLKVSYFLFVETFFRLLRQSLLQNRSCVGSCRKSIYIIYICIAAVHIHINLSQSNMGR